MSSMSLMLMPSAAIAGIGSQLSIGEAQSQLSDLEQFPLFLSSNTGKLVASSTQLSPTDISRPSLSWIREQVGKRYGSDRLVSQWKAYQIDALPNVTLSYVDVIVDEQIWSLLSYFERYAFITQFGSAAKQYGYHLRVFHSGDLFNYNNAQSDNDSSSVTLRGAHICDFQQTPISELTPLSPEAAMDIPCQIVFNDASRREAL